MPDIEFPTAVTIDLQVQCAYCASELEIEIYIDKIEQTMKIEVQPCEACNIEQHNKYNPNY